MFYCYISMDNRFKIDLMQGYWVYQIVKVQFFIFKGQNFKNLKKVYCNVY